MNRKVLPGRHAGALAFATVLLCAASAEAHQSSFTYGQLEVGADRLQIDYRLKLRTTDLYEALELDTNRDPEDAEIRAGAARLYDYVEERVDLELPDDCRAERLPLAIEGGRDRFAVLEWRHRCKRPVKSLALDYQLFFDLDPQHAGLLLVDGETIELRRPDHDRFEWQLGEHIGSKLTFVVGGIDHILDGIDHILFLVSLLLMAVITRSEHGGWKLRPGREGFAYTGTIVTSFTLAHSLTLIAAALGWIDLPSRLVESAIAASIVYVAVENALRPDPPRRYLVTFCFGLMHGLGFARMLRPLLPPSGVVTPLLLFNVGVEIGQLSIVVLALPVLYGLARALGADRYRRSVLPIGAFVLGSMGLIWLIERAAGITILGL